MDVSIIIVNYNTKKLLADCLKSIYEQTRDLEFEVIVSDNDSHDGSIEMLRADFPHVILVENNANLGFGAANNRGLSKASGKYIYYLNSDTILLNNAVKFFFDYWENSPEKDKIGALGTNLLDINKDISCTWGYFPNYRNYASSLVHTIYGFTKLTAQHIFFKKPLPQNSEQGSHEKKIGKVDCVSGASLFLLNDEHAYFDENIFMYCEEILLEWYLTREGKDIFMIDGPQIIHLEGASSKKNKTDIIHERGSFSHIQNAISRIYYFKKTGESSPKILLLKLLTLILWLNPYIFPNARKSIRKMISQ